MSRCGGAGSLSRSTTATDDHDAEILRF